MPRGAFSTPVQRAAHPVICSCRSRMISTRRPAPVGRAPAARKRLPMPSPAVVIGVDSSTQSTKAVLIDAGTGEQLAVGRAPHVVSGEAGARESDPEIWWRALCEAVAAGLKESGLPGRAVTGIAVAGQQHGLVVLDRAGRPLRPALLWNDTRSAPQAAALTEALGGPEAWTGRTGSVPVASITASKWQWLRENDPASAADAAGVRLSPRLPHRAPRGGRRHRPRGRLGQRLVLHRDRRVRPGAAGTPRPGRGAAPGGGAHRRGPGSVRSPKRRPRRSVCPRASRWRPAPATT